MGKLQSKINALLTKFNMNCENSCQLYSESLDRRLSPGERVKIRFHFLMCKWCAVYAEQIGFISKEEKKKR
jgi:hypothetical protein